MRSFLALVLVVAVAFVAAEADVSGARLLVYKDIDKPIAVVGDTLTLTTYFYNVGSSAALEVVFKDEELSAEFELLTGQLSNEWDTIAAGTNVSSVVTLKAKTAGYVRVGPGAVKYRSANDEVVRTAITSEIGTMLIETNMEFRHRTGPQFLDFVLFVLVGGAAVAIPYFKLQEKEKEFAAVLKKK
eukprot:TRINITY_DN2202_c0_g1_i1.p1 TRINITY_DN2202_c0_g1~~TRINITY_DN2202_c0_g1_i1.p1  ORF type:complete len:186 (-),score=56.97 TRINITY_DN2202_c0_g1_i1:497-1054(-)